MSKNQILVLSIALALILGLYFVPTKSSNSTQVDRSRAIEMETTDLSALLRNAREKYNAEQLSEIERLTDLAGAAKVDSVRIGWLEKLSGAWYQLGEPALAGGYAEKIADERNDEDSWGITGTTYASGIKKYTDKKMKDFCQKRAIKALNNAISINPDNSQHRINLALCYVDLPLENDPMKGILMLRDLLDRNPEDVGVLTQLGALAIRTGQYEKATERLGKAFSVQPENKQVLRLLASAYRGMGDIPNAQKYETLLNK